MHSERKYYGYNMMLEQFIPVLYFSLVCGLFLWQISAGNLRRKTAHSPETLGSIYQLYIITSQGKKKKNHLDTHE
jgi:hypothetical protein